MKIIQARSGSTNFKILSLIASVCTLSRQIRRTVSAVGFIRQQAPPLRLHSTLIAMDNHVTVVHSTRKRGRDAPPNVDPRSCAHCIKRMLRQTLLCSSTNPIDDQEQANQKPKWTKKVARPLNSYLKIVLDDVTVDRLHDISLQLGKDVASFSNELKEEGDSNAPDETSKRKGQPLKYKSRSRNSLHFTFFFGGEVLCSTPPDELLDWHSHIRERLAKSNFYLDSDPSNSMEAEEMEKEEYWFRIKELSLFPPRRNPHLIVALLEASPAWHTLHNDIRSIALDGKSESLKSLAVRDKGGDWIPHITLGNLYGGSKDDKDALRGLLQGYSLDGKLSGEYIVDEIGARCVTMGGPIPHQVELDWTFQSR